MTRSDSMPPAARPAPARAGDLTEGPIARTLLAFSIPTLLASVLQTLNGSINAIWVGRLIGESALAATANANAIIAMVMAAVFGFGLAATVRVGIHFGARDVIATRRSFGAGLGLCTVLALALALGGVVSAGQLLHLLGTPHESLGEARTYLAIIFLSLPFAAVMQTLSMAMRGVGDARSPLYAMAVTALLDVVLNPVLILGLGPVPALGIAGSAASTILANLVGVCILVFALYRRDLPLRLRGAEWRWLIGERAELAWLLAKGIPSGTSTVMVYLAHLVMVGLANREGMITSAAYGAVLQLWNYLQMPSLAVAAGAGVMAAQAIGAGKQERVDAVTRVGCLANLAMTGVLAATMVLLHAPLLGLFLGSQSAALPVAGHIMTISTWSYLVTGMTMVFVGSLRAYGIVNLPMLTLFIGLFPVRLAVYFIGYPLIGVEALWWGFPTGSVVTVVLVTLLYAKGGWRRRRGMAHAAKAAA